MIFWNDYYLIVYFIYFWKNYGTIIRQNLNIFDVTYICLIIFILKKFGNISFKDHHFKIIQHDLLSPDIYDKYIYEYI